MIGCGDRLKGWIMLGSVGIMDKFLQCKENSGVKMLA